MLVYGLGSKKALLEDFRVSYLSQEFHLVVNGFFPSITLKSVSILKLLFKVKAYCVLFLAYVVNFVVCKCVLLL